MDRVTKKQFNRATKALPKLREAEAVVKAWNERLKGLGPVAEQFDITELSADGSFKGKRKE